MALRLLLLSGFGTGLWHSTACVTGLGSLQGKACPQLSHGQLQEMARQGPACTPRTKAPASPLLSSSFSWFTVLDGTFQNLNGLAGERGCGKARAWPQGYCTVGSMVEMTRKGIQVLWAEKSSQTARVGLATSHWINSTLSMPDFFYTPLYLIYHNWAKLSAFSFMIVKNQEPSIVTGRVLLWNIKEFALLCGCFTSPCGDRPRNRYGSRQGRALNAPARELMQSIRHSGANTSGTWQHCATSLLSFATRVVR